MLADRIGNEEAAELLRRNGREELAHARRIAKAISIRLGHEWEPSAEIATLLPIPMPDEISIEMFRGIVQGEMSGDAGYQAWADQETDPEVEKLLRLNGREETIHAGRVNQVLEILSR
jgi:rubrerythrin